MTNFTLSLPEKNSPPLSQVLKFYKHRGLVGEERLALLQTLLAIKKSHFGIESLSGGGKSATVDILVNYKKFGDKTLLPRGSTYILGLASKTAPSYQHKEINKAKIIYIEELQKAGGSLEISEMLKNLAEGKESSRLVRDQANRTVDELVISAGKGIIYTLALENQHKNDAEMKRRFIVLSTDVSQKQTKEVVKRKGQERFCKARLNLLNNDEITSLKEHISDCLSQEKIIFENPFAEYLADRMPTPDQKIRSFIDHYFNVIEACTLYHYKERPKYFEGEGENRKLHIFVTLEDLIIVNILYSTFFNRDVHGIPPLGMEVLESFRYIDANKTINATRNMSMRAFMEKDKDAIPKVWASVVDIRDTLKEKQNIILSHKITKETCDDLYNAGYLLKNVMSGGLPEYCVADKIIDFSDEIDWIQCYNAGTINMREFFPEHIKEWQACHEKDDKLVFHHPLEDKTVAVREFNNTQKERKIKKEMHIISESKFEKAIKIIKEHEPIFISEIKNYVDENIIDELILKKILITNIGETHFILNTKNPELKTISNE